MLDTHGCLVTVGLRDEPLLGFNAMSLLDHGAFFGGSHIACKKERVYIVQLAVYKILKPYITLRPMSNAPNAVEAVKRYELKYMGVC
jgi:alcohol dehydrogenase (NADP+)